MMAPLATKPAVGIAPTTRVALPEPEAPIIPIVRVNVCPGGPTPPAPLVVIVWLKAVPVPVPLTGAVPFVRVKL